MPCAFDPHSWEKVGKFKQGRKNVARQWHRARLFEMHLAAGHATLFPLLLQPMAMVLCAMHT